MKSDKTQISKILDGFVTTVVILTAATLVASGIAISKINTEYMTTGIKAAKIVAEHENKEISVSLDDNIIITREKDFLAVDKILSLLPPPINTGYMIVREIKDSIFESE